MESCAFVKSHLQLLEVGLRLRLVLSALCVEGECLSRDSFQQQQTLSRIRCNLRLKLRKVPMAGSTMCRSWEGQW